MSGWDDDEDDLDDMLFDDENVPAPPNNIGDTPTTTTTNDDGSNNNGWDDDDDGLLDDLDDDSGGGGGGVIMSSEESAAAAAAAPPTQPSSEIHHNQSSITGSTEEPTNEQEKIMTHNEISQINMEDDSSSTNKNNNNNNNIEAADNNVEDDDDAWDFEDDEEDIFNEENDDLDFGAGTTSVVPTEKTTATIVSNDASNNQQSPQPSSPPPSLPSLAPIKQSNNCIVPPETKNYPFLQDINDNDKGRPPNNELVTTAATRNDDNEKIDSADDIVSDTAEDGGGGGGWSDDDDDDLFEQEEETTPATALPSSTAPASTSHLSPHNVRSPPVANRTRSKTTTPGPPPPPPQTLQQQQPVTLTPSQQRIHQMLSTYTTNLTDSDYPSRLQYKLHMYQTKSHNTTSTTPPAELRHYYAIRPKLRKYTLGVELDRMDYTLVLENGTCTEDKDVIRSYFGVGDDGGPIVDGGDVEEKEEEEVEEATVEELLIRSANQSLLADALVALTGSEEDVRMIDDGSSTNDDDFFDHDEPNEKSMGLILSGPTLCMSSVAESCQFTVDLQCGKVEALCDLAISVPFHGNMGVIRGLLGDSDEQQQQQQPGEKIIGDGRIILARARVSVRFRPGGEGGNDNDEPTVQYAIQSVNSLLTSNSPILRQVAIALAHDQEDPFFQEEQHADVGDATDIRDLFLLNQHLLSDSGLLAVSDHLERLRGAAEAKSTGFRSALRQLDGVTNVSAKLQFLKGSANATRGQGSGSGSGSGFLGLGLALPSAEEIEAAEREAQSAVTRQDDATFRFPRPNGGNEGLHFPRLDDVNEGYYSRLNNDDRNARPPPPPPPPGRPPQTEQDVARPKPIIGGILMSGLSRLAAAATQPSDLRTEQEWGEEGGTGLTPPSSPKANHFGQAPAHDFPTLYRKESISQSTSGLGGIGGSSSTPLSGPPTHLTAHQPDNQGTEFQTKGEASGDAMLDDAFEDDGGWSDEEFDFEEPVNNDFLEHQDMTNEKDEKATPLPPNSTSLTEKEDVVACLQQGMNQSSDRPFEAKADMQQRAESKRSKRFSDDLSTALQEKIESENKEIIQSGRLKRWTPLREDPILRQKLMEVMVNNLRE